MKYAIWSAIGLVFVHAATELWQLVYAIWPETIQTQVNWFLDKNAIKSTDTPNGIPLLWWIKMLTDEILFCYVFWDYACTAIRTSRKKFMVVFVFFIYHLFDAAMFLYNYKQGHWLYLALLALDGLALALVFIPIKEKAKIIEIK